MQTLEHTPAFVHGGPFANIAHGCNSVMATKTALKFGDYVVTEAGFGADLGAEKFLDIKCRMAGLAPSAVVVVATVRALKHHGGAAKAALGEDNLEALKAGLPNLLQHVGNMKDVYGLPVVVAINRFPTDTEAELALVEEECAKLGVKAVLTEVWGKGGKGGMALAEEVVSLCEQESHFSFSYENDLSIMQKLEAIAKRVYHADGVELIGQAPKQLKQLEALGFGNVPICIAKTQYSFSDNPALLGAPRGFKITVRNLKISAGAGFIVALTGDVMTMPGLPKVPSAEKIDVDGDGVISGLSGQPVRAGGFLDNGSPPSYNGLVAVRRSGGIGRRTGLKIPGRQRRAGSSPAFGTSEKAAWMMAFMRLFAFICLES